MTHEFPKLDECLLAWLGAGRWRVLGRRMKPLTLLHRELLRMAGSGLMTGERLLLPDLDLVVQICRREPRAAAAWLARPKRRWQGRLRAWWLVLLYGWRMKPQWDALREWLESCENAPEMMHKEAKPQAGQEMFLRRDAPPLLDVWTRLAECGFPALEVVEVWPAGLTRWLYETLNTREGGSKFETDEDRQMMEQARQMKKITEPELPDLEVVWARMHALMAAVRGVNR
jgi:hypothetical protein